MAVQIVSLRPYTIPEGKRKGEVVIIDKMHMRYNWKYDSVGHLFANIDHAISNIPESERYNMFYTLHDIENNDRKKFLGQSVIPIDVDGIGNDNPEDYIPIIGEVLGIDMSKVGQVSSGNGVHAIIETTHRIEEEGYFDKNKHHYNDICYQLNTAFWVAGLSGKADGVVFSPGRILRLPNTKNIKKNKGEKECVMLNAHIEAIDFNIIEKSTMPEVLQSEQIAPLALKSLPKPDTKEVQEKCDFLIYCKENQDKVSEPQWYAMLSIIGRLEGADKLAHEYSQGHPDYDADATDRKLDQATSSGYGPRTCANIDTLWEGCSKCPSYGTCKSPIQLRGEGHIATQQTGFYDVSIHPTTGKATRKPNYSDLVKYYNQEGEYAVVESNELVYKWQGSHWEEEPTIRMKAFAEQHFNPDPTEAMCKEFMAKICRTNLRREDWLHEHQGKINLHNGVLDTNDMSIGNHNSKYGFTSTRPFSFNPVSKCDRWEGFVKEICCNRKDRAEVLQEMMGAILMNVDPKLFQKGFVLVGTGSNGKSVFLDVLSHMVGDESVSNTFLKDILTKPESRLQLKDKLLNISDEAPYDAFKHDAMFKTITAGAVVDARKLYHGTLKFKVMAKIVLAANSMPSIMDSSYGMFRRFIIVPFDRTFMPNEQDTMLTSKLIEEASGIFNWALEGYERLKKNSWQFSESEQMVKDKVETINKDDPVIEYFQEYFKITGAATDFVTTREIVKNFRFDNPSSRISDRQLVRSLRGYVAKELGIASLESISKRLDGRVIKAIPRILYIGDVDATSNY